MARKVFFSFHYKNDVWRANQVRNSWVTQGKEAAGFIDAADFEKIEKEGDAAIKRWIDNQLSGTSVTVVLIGAETSKRKWIQYEIEESLKKGNGLLGIYIHKCPSFDGSTDRKGENPFDRPYLDRNGRKVYLSEVYKTYDWIDDNGRENLGDWIESAAKQAGK